MPKTNKLKGLPNTITQQFFSTTFYSGKGYMSDWIFNAASQKTVSQITIDFWNNKIDPIELEIKPILSQLPRLKDTVWRTLKSLKFESDFIRNGVVKIKMGKSGYRYLYCTTILTVKNGKEYIGQEYTESVYEKKFRVFRPSLVQAIKNLFN